MEAHVSDPHAREYLAAADGMAETYGTRKPDVDQPPANAGLPAVGDFVSGVSCGKRWSGRVVATHRNGTVDVEVVGAWLNVRVADITH